MNTYTIILDNGQTYRFKSDVVLTLKKLQNVEIGKVDLIDGNKKSKLELYTANIIGLISE